MNEETTPQSPPPLEEAPAATESVTPPVSPGPPARTGSGGMIPWLIVAVLALGLAGWQWMETRVRLAETRQEIARRLAESDAAAGENRALARQAQEQLGALRDKLNEMEARLAESKSQQEVLGNLYQNLARNSDESILTEIEQGVTLASQQLQLAGNVQGAVLALESADARLADNGQPQFINLRKVLARDLDRLRALPQVDIPGMYLRLENVIETVDALPLTAASRPRDENRPGPPAAAPPRDPLSLDYWRALAASAWRELRGVVRIQRIDRVEPALLPPGQEFFLRENIKLRLLDARLALFARDQRTFRNGLHRSCAWIERYFDGEDKAVQNGLQTLRQLAATEISIELPNLNESLSAIKRFRAEKEH
ncbi:MAG: uroporphyrinogen-III C-methyltransferase [Candidatus Accumulibacter sp.]|jgi:uroporphyrin-3 C-methyltransferase|nr:uroporphyrinogen-III C-methyltransferase [Accumulibacter sp.]